VITLLIALILRAVSIEFWVPESPQRKLWEVLLPASSFFIISILCIMLGNLLSGLHLDTDYNYTGGLSGLFKPFTLGLVVMGITAVCMQGVTYASLQVAGSLEERVRQVGLRVLVLNIIAFVIFSIFLFSFVHGAISSVAVWIGIGVTFMSIILIARAVFSEYESTAFIMSSVSIIGLWVIIGGAQFPNFVRSTEDQSKCLTIYNAMNTHATLNNMLYFVIPAILAVVLFTIWIHKVIKVSVRGGKRKIESE
jgi:cytochrome d ubiquinol oxidase subunit II